MVWTGMERAAISALETEGFTPVQARILTAMVMHRYARERRKLVDVLSGHIGLESTASVNVAIDDLLARQLLTLTPYVGNVLITTSTDYVGQLKALNLLASATALESLGRMPVLRFESLGHMTDRNVLDTFHDAVCSAHRIIRITFFESLAGIEGLQDLRDRSSAGVEIRVLLGSPKVMKELRGASHEQRARRAIESWKTATSDWPNTEVRIAVTAQDIECGSSVSIDGRILRLDVHEPLAERSLMGEMLMVNERGGNLIRLFDANFDAAWDRATPTRRTLLVRRAVVAWRWTATAMATVTAAALLAPSAWRELLTGVAATSLLAAADENRARFRLLWRRLKGEP
ncbi:hypothetical protein BDK92_1555 [Micromonospora pisi]|uniref:Uncharacterized protein n=1 Tax=Micromonospora pisi TaxID=589240 RepID=A0A495JE53_9ACTN|nr:hypothetical protein [Micromonospora pisi]RKR87280.1 hypothetical protein BDK92_1555 [Micromonospora pisi]